MGNWKSRHETVQAIQFKVEELSKAVEFCSQPDSEGYNLSVDKVAGVFSITLKEGGQLYGNSWDWIVRLPSGEIFPMPLEIFGKVYRYVREEF